MARAPAGPVTANPSLPPAQTPARRDTGVTALLREVWDTPPLRLSAVFRSRYRGKLVTWAGAVKSIYTRGDTVVASFGSAEDRLSDWSVTFWPDQKGKLLDAQYGDTLVVRAKIDSLSYLLHLNNGVVLNR